MKPIIIVVVSFFLESIFSCYVPLSTHTSLPLFTLVSLLVCRRYFMEARHYYIFCFFVGLFYDIAWLGILFLHSVLFLATSYVDQKVMQWMRDTWRLLILLFSIIVYRVFSYGLLLLIGYPVPYVNLFFQVLLASILWNILYGWLLCKIGKLGHKKKF